MRIYDALDRLTDAVTSGGPKPSRFKYVLDGDGNRTSQTTNRTASTGGDIETYGL